MFVSMAESCTVCFLNGSGEVKSKSSSPKRLKPVDDEENREVVNTRSKSEVMPSKMSVKEKYMINKSVLQVTVVAEKTCRL